LKITTKKGPKSKRGEGGKRPISRKKKKLDVKKGKREKRVLTTKKSKGKKGPKNGLEAKDTTERNYFIFRVGRKRVYEEGEGERGRKGIWNPT